ncbi:NADPH-dependent 1-acyldihydroxyacetone phosphate reductase [Candida viswanathii]|uniref:NADPH-dependent 1-acyldihydroxyacetone phosphate reductase n=1 Tax=Candida viswanathii TaxID=5486 RepID=A0A367XRM5_9ASCO|nr:NADPH-dependent 1-acyldihydroxyacetone phosphate reductase [Candida viswanathii]
MSERQKVALVTGASSGIGYATAIEFAKRGYKVFAGARRLEPMQKLKDDYGVYIFKLDVSDLDSVKDARKLIEAETGDDYLDFLQCFEVNVFGAIRTTRELVPLLINAKGVVGFTGSVSGIIPFPFSCIYSASKAAIHQYAATLRLELKPFGVKVINIVTGGVKTDIEDKRDLPETSLYNVPGITEAFNARRQMAARNKPMPAAVYASKVVTDFENATLGGALNYYRGKMSTFLGHVLNFVPRFIVEYALVRKFQLVGIFAYLKQKYLKEKVN